MSKERVNIYFNTDIPEEKAMWDFINSYGKKSYVIKKAIWMAMNPGEIKATPSAGATKDCEPQDDKPQDNKDNNLISQDSGEINPDDIDDDIFA